MVTELDTTTLESVKILFVNDRQENHTALESVFEQNSYSFIKAYSGNEALKLLLEHDDFALILIDTKMHDMSGFETASMICNREKLSHIPIIFITSNDNEVNLFKSYSCGGVDYIVKPINPELLKIKIKVFIELFKKNRELLLEKLKLVKINEDLRNELEEKQKTEEELRLKNLQLADEKKRIEKKLSAFLKEKEILIKEIHHRVKNNLQVISSLLNIQKFYIKNRQLDKVIDESRDRIHSMALLYEKLYQSKNLSLINFKSYIEDITLNLLHTYCTTDKKIDFEIISINENINIDLGISLGLILNEFISNSIKHGFKNINEGKILIRFEKADSNTFLLSVKDNGRGLEEDFDINKAETLGLQLVKSLVEQIKGNLEIIRNSGTEFKILYPSEIGY